MLPPDHFLSRVVDKALYIIQERAEFRWEANYFTTTRLSDPFQIQAVSDAASAHCANHFDDDIP
jgi:hypothetical protein